MSKMLVVGRWLLTLLLFLAFFSTGVGKLLDPGTWLTRFEGWGWPGWMVYVTGLLEVAGAVLLVPLRTAPLGAVLLATVMVGAVGTRVANGIAATALNDIVLLLLALAAGAVTYELRRRKRSSA